MVNIMNFNATKYIEILSFSAVITLKVGEVRPEIASYLDGERDWLSHEEQSIFESLYLEAYLGIYKNGQLTLEGQRIRDTGKVFIPEHGLYELHLINNNIFRKKKIINFKRKKPTRQITGKHTDSFDSFHEYEGHYFTTLDKEKIEFSVNFHVNRSNQVPHVIWNNEIRGQVTINSGSMTGTSLHLQYNHKHYTDHNYKKFNLSSNMHHLLETWNSETESAEKSFEELTLEEKDSFQTGLSTTEPIILNDEIDSAKWRIEIQNVPLLPKTQNDAKQWLEYLLTKQLKNEKSYFTHEYIETIQKQILEKTPLIQKYPNLWISGKSFHQTLANRSSTIFTDVQTAQDLLPNLEEIQ
jgi:hypothetical protein